MTELIYHSTPHVTFATNIFIDVPTILQFDETPLISVVQAENLGYTTEIPIFHADGTYLAKVRGTRVYATPAGTKAGVTIRQLPGLWVCEVGGRTAFEIRQQAGDAFRTDAELYTPTGHFLRFADSPAPELLDPRGGPLHIGGLTMSQSVFEGCRIGVLLGSDGSMAIGVSLEHGSVSWDVPTSLAASGLGAREYAAMYLRHP